MTETPSDVHTSTADASTDATETTASSTYKVLGEFTDATGAGVLGKNKAGSGTPIGVEGAVPNSSNGYGLSTPDDANVGGTLDAAGVAIQSSGSINDASGNAHLTINDGGVLGLNRSLSTNGNQIFSASGTNQTLGIDGGRTVLTLELPNTAVSEGSDTELAPNIVMGHPRNNTGGNSPKGATVLGGGRYDDFNLIAEPNVASADYATAGGGKDNTASGSYAITMGGSFNEAAGAWSTVGGGHANAASGSTSTIAGGVQQRAGGQRSMIGGGYDNSTPGSYATIGGGRHNSATSGATIAGGTSNAVKSAYASVSGGQENTASGSWGVIGGGRNNTASGEDATVSGGNNNTASGADATVGGGDNNNSTAGNATVAGGDGNTADNSNATVGGGINNTATHYDATVAGGDTNTANGNSAFIGGGDSNEVQGGYAVIPGGSANKAGGQYSFAAGRKAKTETSGGTRHDGAFVWGDSTDAAVRSQAADQVVFRCTGGMYVGDDNGPSGDFYANGKLINTSSGAYLTTGGTWTDSSSRTVKEHVDPVDAAAVLDRVESLPISEWSYTDEDVDVRHMGPMAEDFHETFGLGVDDEHVAALDTGGVALAAIQGLAERLEKKDARIERIEAENEQLRERLSALEARVGADTAPTAD